MYTNVVFSNNQLPPSAHTAEASLAVRTMAVESMALTNMASSFMARFAPIKTFFDESFSFAGFKNSQPDLQLTNVENALCRRVTGGNFVGLRSLAVSCAPGWNCTMAEAKPVVHQILEDLRNFSRDILEPHYLYLGVFLTNKEAKEKGKDNTHVFKKLQQRREDDAKERAKLFGNTANQGEIGFGLLLDRASDLSIAFDDVTRARKLFSEIDFVAIKAKMHDIIVLIDEIIAQIEDDKIANMPADTAKTISDGTYEIARQAEFMSASAVIVMNYLGLGNNLVVALQKAEKEGLI